MNIISAALLVLLSSASALDPLNLGSSSCYVILSKAYVDNIGTSYIDGNVGTSSAVPMALSGFALDPPFTGDENFSKSTMVTGRLYAAYHMAPTPFNLDNAVNDMERAYLEAIEITSSFINLQDGSISTNTVLAPDAY